MKALVLDAGVAIKWCIPPIGESFVPQALRLLDSYTRGQIRFIVPDVFAAELGTMLSKTVRQGRSPVADAVAALELIGGLRIPTISSAELLPEALAIALAHDRPIYETLYVALAVQSKTEMITADEQSAKSLAAYLPVKWLGAL